MAASRDGISSLKVENALDFQAGADLNGESIDTTGFEELTFALLYNGLDTDDVAELKILESDDDVTFDIARVRDVLPQAQDIAPASNDEGVVLLSGTNGTGKIGYVGGKKYAKLRLILNGATITDVDGVAILDRPSREVVE